VKQYLQEQMKISSKPKQSCCCDSSFPCVLYAYDRLYGAFVSLVFCYRFERKL
jgi:hypothetical protein